MEKSMAPACLEKTEKNLYEFYIKFWIVLIKYWTVVKRPKLVWNSQQIKQEPNKVSHKCGTILNKYWSASISCPKGFPQDLKISKSSKKFWSGLNET